MLLISRTKVVDEEVEERAVAEISLGVHQHHIITPSIHVPSSSEPHSIIPISASQLFERGYLRHAAIFFKHRWRWHEGLEDSALDLFKTSRGHLEQFKRPEEMTHLQNQISGPLFSITS